MRTTRRRALIAGAAALCTLLTGCGAADMTKQTSPFAAVKGARTVTLSVQSWVGAQANVAVAQYLLEHELGYRVDTVQVDEVPAWDALSQGRVDAILEDWGHPDQEKRYVDDKKTIVRGGDLGVTGHIGWFVPTYLAKQHPDITDWRNLNSYASLFRTAESGGKGQLMDGSPSYVTNDKALVKNLGLNYQVVFAGSEAAQIAQIKQFAKEKKPFLTYWYAPQWLFEKVPMTEVKLPPYTEGCDADPAKVACSYPYTPLQKYLNARFAASGGDAAAFLKKFRWTTEDQNEVALMIADQKLTPAEAAKKWVEGHRSVWKEWLP
ncbi:MULTISPECIES: ABC transporter substrate-binding protein [Streptomyces]|uniref:ABC transporter substrate-binding protein n=1 Tax=Streptomyces thermoviolaceus subsp. thermoviolaceus TaxID=66860 RepID=A0ABX0YU94_STRTL|nr:ABC transporter substrate-binding protein [Streptomyces thermoviolaceus]MCM3263751.1 glycine/betaine ABC transporter substrate-binding protein [Streptomyces thermoviolaceus]NJP14670.1 ABC transporter substrate-binding protein [Streptomyces thermoviolaceus subsp. thermoviolaceus]GGV74894.1 glycine/betaine-binding protein [Streptomyces thermoviolaceus subsp. apingens]GHA93417.1 glycine/betaine-binding protein [Streptomyces thermoviolaceus subsp. thermoviolaceus]